MRIWAAIAILAAAVCWGNPASAQPPWGPPARQVRAETNLWSFIPVSKTNVQLVLDWLDDSIGLDGSAWTNLPSSSTNEIQNLFDWIDVNWLNVSNGVTAAFPYLDRDYRDDITNLAFGSSGTTNWTFATTNGTGYVGVPESIAATPAPGSIIGWMVKTGMQAAAGGGVQTKVSSYTYHAVTNGFVSLHNLSAGVIGCPTGGVYQVNGNVVLQSCEVSFSHQADIFFWVNGEPNPLKYPYVSAYDESTQVGYSLTACVTMPPDGGYVELGVFGEWGTCGGTSGVPHIVHAEFSVVYLGE